MVASARRRLGELGDRVRFQSSTFEQAQLSESAFDALFSATAFHLGPEPRCQLGEGGFRPQARRVARTPCSRLGPRRAVRSGRRGVPRAHDDARPRGRVEWRLRDLARCSRASRNDGRTRRPCGTGSWANGTVSPSSRRPGSSTRSPWSPRLRRWRRPLGPGARASPRPRFALLPDRRGAPPRLRGRPPPTRRRTGWHRRDHAGDRPHDCAPNRRVTATRVRWSAGRTRPSGRRPAG